MWKLLQKEEPFYSHRGMLVVFYKEASVEANTLNFPHKHRDKRGGCVFLSERDKVMMHTFPTVHKHSANCLLTAFQQEFNSNFFLWLVVSAGRGIVALWGLRREDGATQRETIVCFYPQAIWVFWLLSLCLSKDVKAAGWLTKTGVAVTASDIFYTLLLFSLLDTASYMSLLCFHWDTGCFSSSCDWNSLVSLF